MAANLEIDLCCPVCLDVYRDPVLLRCGHNFCRVCIERYVEESEEPLTCPFCRAEFEEDSIYCNRQLANVIAGVLDLRVSAGAQDGDLQCGRHRKPLELFCQDDKQLVCLICALSQDHKGHNCVLKDEAYEECKEILKCEIASLEEEFKNYTTMRMSQGQNITRLLDMTESLREEIAEKFETLHNFLNTKECAIVQNLAEKEEHILKQLEENVLILSRECDNVEAIIQDISVVVKSEDSNQLLKEFANLKKRSESIYDPILTRPDVNLDEFYGPLQYGAWKQMKKVIKIVPSPVRFDPKTANPRLRISNLGRKLIYCEIQSEPPATPERFTNHLSVVASSGLTSGIHYWEVNVSEGSDWYLGVATASVNRKVRVVTKPENGYWTIARRCGVNYFAYGRERVIINPDINLEMVGVYLDYERGKLSFYDAEDMFHIYTFSDTFTEELYPYFSINCNEQSVAPTLELFHLDL
ncbi:E3 ubiquitin-protein ligase TRIM39-like [Rhincodon typus]|uniref:E3 ubiquitin-protein ligase TRIM39-like n=1 Tax=Rhincodon typus TaxID=259920 RepID=UPI00202E1A7D|nr:E3 ubiquitin-protein ligase TRIM39-like [Rhincodon typus]